MITAQDFHQLRERITKLEQEVALLRKKVADSDWEAKVIEHINKGDMVAAMQAYQDYDRHASISEATMHVLEIKKKIGK